MNWKIIFQLSIFGLIMAFATVQLIPERVEPIFWLFIFRFLRTGYCQSLFLEIFSAWFFGKHGKQRMDNSCSRYFPVDVRCASPADRFDEH
jgi:hypothetical protein